MYTFSFQTSVFAIHMEKTHHMTIHVHWSLAENRTNKEHEHVIVKNKTGDFFAWTDDEVELLQTISISNVSHSPRVTVTAVTD